MQVGIRAIMSRYSSDEITQYRATGKTVDVHTLCRCAWQMAIIVSRTKERF